jgi:hypothetical protein
MVQIVENHAELSGELLSIAPDDQRPGFVTLRVRAIEAKRIGDWPNLFAADVGQTIVVIARADSAPAMAEPGPVTLRVKKTGPGISFAEE